METLSLNGPWRLNWFDPGKGVDRSAHAPEHNDGGWLPAEVPGEIHLSLRQAGIFRGQLYEKSPDEERWAERCEWWYRKSFVPDAALAARHVELVFDGLDTLATVYLNGREIARANNMHLPLRVDVTKALLFGRRNVIAVCLSPVDKLAEGKSLAGLYTTTCAERLFVRKAQVSFGWDFHGRMVTCGLWQGVRLESWSGPRIESVQVVARPTKDGGAEFAVAVERRGTGGALDVAIREKGGHDWLVEQKLAGGKGRIGLKKAKLWWPWSMGKPNLYEVRVRLTDGRKVLEENLQRVGVRTIELIQDPIEDGTRFGFRVNGRDTFICGANWVPPSPYYADVTEQTYRKLLTYAVRGNITMLRVWGGGVYEYDSFYDVCDELGVLIWHDFMWACGVYPDGPADRDNARKEAEFQIKRLRNHPCMAAWCGDNEDDWAFQWGQLSVKQRNTFGITRKVLPGAVAKLDATRPYVPSSPFSPNDDDCNSSREGDQHQYRWGSLEATGEKSYTNFFKDRSRFVSEFGSGSLPGIETLGIYNYTRKEMDVKRWGGQPLPPNAPDAQHALITGRQFLHSQFQKRVLEHYRRIFPVCSGTLHWKFNDPFSCGSGFGLMASVDPLGAAKMSFYYAKRAYAPVSASIRQEDDRNYTVWVCNGTAKPFRGKLVVELVHQDNHRRTIVEADLNVPADTSREIAPISFDKLGWTRWEDQRDNVAAIRLVRDGKEVYFDTHWFMEIRREPGLVLIWGSVKASVEARSADELAVTLRADRYLRPVELVMPGLDVSYDDNFVDLLPDEDRTIVIRRWPWDKTTRLTEQVLWVRGWNFQWVSVST